ncbi:MAG TPA: IS200/IS605 family transposase [Bacteroidales bacterium]|nr:IS200/IS605 family transposase [Bacteroidales bacterium]
MGSYRQILYHLVISTRCRKYALTEKNKAGLFKYMTGIVQHNQCHLYRINGVNDHIHLLTDLHPTVPLADLIKDIKLASSQWMKKSGQFSAFEGWAEGYGAFTYAYRDKEKIMNYINNQEVHHGKKTSREEFCDLLVEAGVDYKERFLP